MTKTIITEVKLKELDMKSKIIHKALSNKPLTLDVLKKIYRITDSQLRGLEIDHTTFWRTSRWTKPRKDTFDKICSLFELDEEELSLVILEWKIYKQ